ncbi:MAG: hypothetical protein ACOX2N_02840 [Peptococcia bacterium]|jgi:hypothetical protein
MILLLLSIIAFMITTRLWKWYDSILNAFSLKIRILDIFTWGLILWFILIQYRKFFSNPQIYFTPGGIKNFWVYISQYCNIYTWCSLTVIGFMVVGLLRLFIKSELFNK